MQKRVRATVTVILPLRYPIIEFISTVASLFLFMPFLTSVLG